MGWALVVAASGPGRTDDADGGSMQHYVTAK